MWRGGERGKEPKGAGGGGGEKGEGKGVQRQGAVRGPK